MIPTHSVNSMVGFPVASSSGNTEDTVCLQVDNMSYELPSIPQMQLSHLGALRHSVIFTIFLLWPLRASFSVYGCAALTMLFYPSAPAVFLDAHVSAFGSLAG